MPYASVEQLRAYLEQVPAGASEDTLLGKVLDRATDIVRSAIRAAIPDPTFDYAAWGAASARRVRAYSGDLLALPPHQAGSISSVVYGETATIDTTTYEETPYGNLQIVDGGGFYPLLGGDWGRASYMVTAVWGYGPDVPPAIEELTLQVAVNLWRAKDQGGYSETVGADGSGAIRVITGLNQQQQMILQAAIAPYRQVSV